MANTLIETADLVYHRSVLSETFLKFFENFAPQIPESICEPPELLLIGGSPTPTPTPTAGQFAEPIRTTQPKTK
jgi:hypothetical protein